MNKIIYFVAMLPIALCRRAVRAAIMWAVPDLGGELMRLRGRQNALQVLVSDNLRDQKMQADHLREYVFVLNRLVLQQQKRLDDLEQSPTQEALGKRVARLELHVLPCTVDERMWESARDAAHIEAVVNGGRGGVRS
jgi:hypothetical protein